MNKRLKRALNTYAIIGKAIFTTALASLGLVLGGPVLATIGIITGVATSELLAKHLTK